MRTVVCAGAPLAKVKTPPRVAPPEPELETAVLITGQASLSSATDALAYSSIEDLEPAWKRSALSVWCGGRHAAYAQGRPGRELIAQAVENG